MNLYQAIAKIRCQDADEAYTPMPYGMGEAMLGNLTDYERYPGLLNEIKQYPEAWKPIDQKMEVLLSQIKLISIQVPWIPANREKDGVRHMNVFFRGRPLSTQAVEGDLGYLLMSLIFPEDTVIIHGRWPDGYMVSGTLDRKARILAATLAVNAQAVTRKRTPGLACPACILKDTCQPYAALETYSVSVKPMAPNEKDKEAHKLWLTSMMLEAARKGLKEKVNAVNNRLLELSNGGKINVGGYFTLDVKQKEEGGEKGTPYIVKAGMEMTVDSANLIANGFKGNNL